MTQSMLMKTLGPLVLALLLASNLAAEDPEAAPGDATPPVMSALSVSASSSAAVVSWRTDELAVASVRFGTSTAYPGLASAPGWNLTHSVALAGLLPETTYHFRARSRDAAANIGFLDGSFVTPPDPADRTPPAVSILTPEDGAVLAGTATLTALASDESSGVRLVRYRVDQQEPSPALLDAPYAWDWDTRSVADGTHTVRASARDAAGNVATDSLLVTVDNTAPEISAFAAVSVGSASATLSWNTNEPARTRVDFGTTTSYGSAGTAPGLTLGHSVTLHGLSAGTLYHARARSRDAAGNVGEAAISFTTPIPVDDQPPAITALSVSASSASAVVSWRTDEPATSLVSYGTATSSAFSAAAPGRVREHAVTLDGLAAGTSYRFRVRSRDAAGNNAVSGESVFRTLPDPFPPASQIVSPSTGAVITRAIVVLARVADENALAAAELRVDGVFHSSAALSGSTATVRLPWDALRAPAGPHLLSVLARDASGNETESRPVDVVVPSRARNGFKIIWGIGTQLEPLADRFAEPEIAAQLAEMRAKSDGYVLGGGGAHVGYWPGGPFRCMLNKKTGDDDPEDPPYIKIDGVRYHADTLRADCAAEFERYIDELRPTVPEYARLNSNQIAAAEVKKARGRAVANLGLAAEQSRGKLVRASSLINNKAYAYDSSTDLISVTKAPDWVEILQPQNVRADTMFVYQEPSIPEEMLQVPSTRGGSIEYLPWNVRFVDMLGDAYARDGYEVGPLGLNIRTWDASAYPLAERLARTRHMGDFNFEGGTALLFKTDWTGQLKLDIYMRGMAHVLRHTDADIYLLMAGNWQCGTGDTCLETDTLETRAAAIPRLKRLVRLMDEKLRAETEGEFGVCTPRLHLQAASYGFPLHMPQLPIRTPSGKLAGSVGGEIASLFEDREELCSSSASAAAAAAPPPSKDAPEERSLVRLAGAPESAGSKALVLSSRASGGRSLEFAPEVRQAALLDSGGRKVAEVSGGGGLALTLPSGLSSGLWIVQYTDASGRVRSKPVIVVR